MPEKGFGPVISIHALLAESDTYPSQCRTLARDFYPRSPCGERRKCAVSSAMSNDFYPRSPCGERHSCNLRYTGTDYFYPRSPCGERRLWSTETARRFRYFYPRSPCGERPYVFAAGNKAGAISIHALLAESDVLLIDDLPEMPKFLSTLSLRRATLVKEDPRQ